MCIQYRWQTWDWDRLLLLLVSSLRMQKARRRFDYQQYTTIYFTLNSDSENQDGWYIYLSDDELNDDEIEALQKKVSIS